MKNLFRNGVFIGFSVAFLMPSVAAEPFVEQEFRAEKPVASFSKEAFSTERQALAQEMMELIKSGASAEKIEEWHEKNSARYAALHDAAVAMAAAHASASLPLLPDRTLTEGVSDKTREFHQKRMELHRSRVELINRMSGTQPEKLQQELEKWETATASERARVEDLARELGEASRERPVAEPLPLRIPSGVSPEGEAFLTMRHTLMRERTALLNEYRLAPPQVFQQALNDWNERHADRLRDMQEAVSFSTPSK